MHENIILCRAVARRCRVWLLKDKIKPWHVDPFLPLRRTHRHIRCAGRWTNIQLWPFTNYKYKVTPFMECIVPRNIKTVISPLIIGISGHNKHHFFGHFFMEHVMRTSQWRPRKTRHTVRCGHFGWGRRDRNQPPGPLLVHAISNFLAFRRWNLRILHSKDGV